MKFLKKIIRTHAWVILLLGHFLILFPSSGAEFRALWVDTFHPALRNLEEIKELVEAARAGHFNSLFVEVRKRGDAYYESELEPKAEELAGGFDPLAELINEAQHEDPARSLEVHAWIVVYPVWHRQDRSPESPRHVFNQHPEWLTQDDRGNLWDGANYSLDPGHPEVQAHLHAVAMDLITRYEIDGLHFDYIRYSGPNWGYNPVAVERFNAQFGRAGIPAPTDPGWSQFRRDQVTALVRKIYLSGLAVKPQVRISAATICWTPAVVRASQWTGSAAYSRVLQDWRAWMEEGILDLNIPMAYFRQRTDEVEWLRWNEFTKQHQYARQAAMGVAFYLNPIPDILAQISLALEPARNGNTTHGIAGFSYASPNSAQAPISELLEALTEPAAAERHTGNPQPLFEEPRTPPGMPWKEKPAHGHLKGLLLDQAAGAPLDGAAVTLLGPDPRNLRTDATGFFGAVDLVPGQYLMLMEMEGFAPQACSLPIKAGEVIQITPEMAIPGMDGIPEWWSRFYFEEGSVDPEGDLDQDGYSNREEYRFGTAPNDAKSHLRFSIKMDEDGNFAFQVSPYLPHRPYLFEMAEHPNSADWQRITPQIISVKTDGSAELRVPAREEPSLFFRLVQSE